MFSGFPVFVLSLEDQPGGFFRISGSANSLKNKEGKKVPGKKIKK